LGEEGGEQGMNDAACCFFLKRFGAVVQTMYDFMHSFQFTEYTNYVSEVEAEVSLLRPG
jgi:hypothetical protein